MLNKRILATSLLAATAAVACAAPAAAQRIERVVAFGDSYADSGLARTTIINDPAASASIKGAVTQFYPTGRFSGGTNYIDTLSALLDAPVANFAVGGALATTFPNGASNTNCSPPGGPGSPATCPLGLAAEVDQFLNAGTQNPLFPSAGPTFDSNDLVTVSIGGNDARYYQQFFAAAPMTPFVTASIAGATTQLNRLVAAGAPTISFLAGDTGRLPEVIADPSAQAIRSAYSSAFNSGLQGTLAGFAANGVIVHYLDINIVLDNVIADPAAYGITQGTSSSLFTCPLPTPTNPGCLLNASGYLFYFDGLHLTSDGFAIVARYVEAQLAAPLRLQATSDLALDTARQFGRTLTTRMDLGAPRDGDMPEGFGLYVVGDSVTRKVKASATNDRFAVTSVGATVGAEYGFGSGLIGAAVNLSRPKADFRENDARTKSKSLQLGVYGSAGIAGGFVQAYAGYGRDDHDIGRDGVELRIEADTDGSHTLAGIKAGFLMPAGSIRVGPVIALDHARAKVDRYTEQGDAALNLTVDDIRYSSLRGSIGGEVRGDFEGGGVQLRPFAAAVIEKDFKGDDRSFAFAQTSAPTIVNRFDVEDGSKKAYGRFSAGFSAAILQGISLNVAGSATARKDQGNETSAHLGLRAAF